MSKESEKAVEKLLKEINEKLATLNEIMGFKPEKEPVKKKKSSSYDEAYKKAMAPYERGNAQIKEYQKNDN